MTATLPRPSEQTLWGTMPGWGIVVDLTPREIVAARGLSVLRRLIALALAGLIVILAAWYAYAWTRTSSAQSDADAASSQTLQLQAAARKYSGVTQIENALDSVKSQVQSVMGMDVNLPRLISGMRAALPGSMSIQNMTVSMSSAASPMQPVTGLDMSGHSQIGTVKITGLANSLDDLPSFVDRLSAMRGVVDVVPNTNQQAADQRGKVQFDVSFALTDVVLSHVYDATTGGK